MHTADTFPITTQPIRECPKSPAASGILRTLVVVAVMVGVALAISSPASADTGEEGVNDNQLADVIDLRVLDPEVSAPADLNRDETIALATSSWLISLIGAVVLAAGVVLAVVAVESRSRDETEGELMGRA